MFEVRRKDRARSLAIVLVAHGVAVWLALTFASSPFNRPRDATLEMFDLRPPAPPPPEPPAEQVRRARTPADPRPQGAVASQQPNPPRRETPDLSTPIASVSQGTPASAPGGAPTGGAGSGSGSAGSGPGQGAGSGTPAVRARLTAGRIVPRDYPRAAGGHQGDVTVLVAVGATGSVTGCSVARSSGNAALDATTCRLIRERFRYAPARDAQGRPVGDELGWRQSWWRD